MLKKRIIATLVVKDGIVVQSITFNRFLPVGKPTVAVEFLNQWGVDEIILLDISATRNGRRPDYDMVRKVSTSCRVPLTVGGGISHVDHISKLIHCGADKVALNQEALRRPELLTEAAALFGSQCLVASIDALFTDVGHRVYNYLERKALPTTPAELAREVQKLGAGEILLNSVDRDGSYRGFDLALIDRVCAAVTVPLICCGGAGHAHHFVEAFEKTRVNAAAAANFFHFTEHSVTTTKALINRHMVVRHESYFNYHGARFDGRGRLMKKDDQELEDMLFERMEKEVI